jgi:hypothetical protein
LVNYGWTDINIDDVFVAILVHLIRKFAVPATNHKYLVLRDNPILSEGGQKFRIFGIPIEKSTILDVSVLPKGSTCVFLPRIDLIFKLL